MSLPAHRPPQSFKRRASRVTSGQAEARGRLWASVGVEMVAGPLDVEALFGRRAPLVVDIGFGMGEATAEMAEAQPGLDVLAVDVHTPGHGALLREVENRVLTNVRICDGDAVVLLTSMLPTASVQEVRVFFPDPWPKRRHWKRRLVDDDFLTLLADRLTPGGRLHVATDWAHYAEQVRRLLAGHASYLLVDDVPWRARTRYERQGLAAGRPAHDVVAVRR